MKKYLKYIISASIVVTILLVDIISKVIAVSVLECGKAIPVLGEFLKLDLCFNTGIAFSFLEDAPWYVLSGISLIMSGVIIFFIIKYGDFKKKPVGSIALALMLGGSLGNLVDRISNFPALLYDGPLLPNTTNVGVVDFINTNYIFELVGLEFGIWNIADACLVVGTFALLIHVLFFDKDEKKKKEENKETIIVDATVTEDKEINNDNTNEILETKEDEVISND